MKGIVLLLFFFSSSIFFFTLGLFSSSYAAGGNAYSIYYAVWTAVVGVTIYLSSIKKMANRGIKITRTNAYILCLFVFLLLCSFYGYLLSGTEQIIRYFLSFTTPAIFLALFISEKDIEIFYKYLKHLNFYLTLCILVAYFATGSSDAFTTVGGTTHLLIGYTMAMLFPYNFMNFINGKGVTSRLFHLSLIMVNISMVLFSGARGAMVGMAVTFLYLSYGYIIKRKRFVILAVTVSLISYAVTKLIGQNSDSLGLKRISLLFKDDLGVSSSGRSIYYETAISQFKEHPILGNGVATFSNKFGFYTYPHNLLLEILTQFGIIGLIAVLIIAVYVIKNAKFMIKNGSIHHQYIVLLLIQSIVMLMFSSSYLTSLQLWIPLVLILAARQRNKKLMKDHIPRTQKIMNNRMVTRH